MDNTDLKTIHKAAALYIDKDHRLLLSRDKGTTKWQVLGGKIEQNETHVDCLKREAKEELDADITVEEKLYLQTPPLPAANDPGLEVIIYCYFCNLLTEPNLIENVEQIHWFTKEEFESGAYEFSQATKKIIFPQLLKDNIVR